eukprot:scaffold235449_cov12-Tisochrysis_lutea.AAC.1
MGVRHTGGVGAPQQAVGRSGEAQAAVDAAAAATASAAAAPPAPAASAPPPSFPSVAEGVEGGVGRAAKDNVRD